MRHPDNLLGLLDELYESVLQPSMWSGAMRSLADFAGAQGTAYLTTDVQKQAILRGECEGLDPVLPLQYIEYYASREIRLAPALKYPVGAGFTEGALVDRREYERSEIYCDFLLPNDIPYVYGLWVTRSTTTASMFLFERSRRQGCFERNDEDRCGLVAPHLVRALHARDVLARARQRERVCFSLLDRLPVGVVLLDERLRVIESSSRATAVLDERTTLLLDESRIRASHASDDIRLQHALRAAASSRAQDRGPGSSVIVRGAGNPASLNVTVLPVRDSSVFSVVKPAAILLFSNRGLDARGAAIRAQRAFGLTQAEAVLACTLSSGITLREAAETLRRSVNTCKSQLKGIYQKLGCRSHTELAKALLSLDLSASG